MEPSVLECRRKLRSLELNAFGSVVDALRAQGALTEYKQEVLNNLASALNVSEERGKCEIRRAVNDETLTSIAGTINGHKTEDVWRLESMRKIPFMPMVASKSVYTSLANNVARMVSNYNEELAKNSNSAPSFEEIRRANIQKNKDEEVERKMLNSFLEKIDFDEEAISKELQQIDYDSYRQLSHPEAYAKLISELEKCSQTNTEPYTQREEVMMPPPTFQPSSQLTVPVNKETIRKSSSLKQTNAKSVSDVLVEEPVKEKSLKRVVSADKPATNEPPKRSRIREPWILPPPPSEEPTRMVRKAKLNAKRWNPKTQTLESPSNLIDVDVSPAESTVIKAKPPIRNRTPKDDARQKVAPVEGDTPQKTVCSTKRGRRTPRLSWGRRRRRRRVKKNIKNVESAKDNSSVISDLDSTKTDESMMVNDLEENSKSTSVTVEDSESRPSEETKSVLHSPAPTINSPTPKNNSQSHPQTSKLLARDEWLRDIDSGPTSRRINILRKRVLTGGSLIEQAKKFCEKEVPKLIHVEYPKCDSESRTETTKKMAEVVSTTNAKEAVESSSTAGSKETASSKSVELVPSTFTIDDSQDTMKTNSDDFKKVDELIANFMRDTQQKLIANEYITSTTAVEVVPNSTLRTREKGINCDSALESKDSSRSSTTIILKDEGTESEASAAKPEENVASDQKTEIRIAKPQEQPRRVRILTPRCGKNISRSALANNVPDQVTGAHAKRVKILPAGCGKTVSQLLLGSNVRVRNPKSLPPDLASLQVKNSLDREDANADEVAPPSSSESGVVSDGSPGKSLYAEELMLSGSDDDEFHSDVSTNLVVPNGVDADLVAGSDALNGPRIQIESDERLIDSINSLPQSAESTSENESCGATKAKKDVMNTISIINEDWKDADSTGLDEMYRVRQTDKVKDIDELVEKSTASTSDTSPRLIVDDALSTMIGIPPWAPKVIKANVLPGTMYCRILSSDTLRTYVPKNNNIGSMVVDKPSSLSRKN